MPAKKVKFILAWQTYRVGDVIEPNGTLRDWLLANKFVTPVETVGTVKRPLTQRVRDVMTRKAA